jgi:hypothetical protein
MSHALKDTPKGEIQTKLPYLAVLRTSEHWYVIVILLMADLREVKRDHWYVSSVPILSIHPTCQREQNGSTT